jgi:hypothetical protein
MNTKDTLALALEALEKLWLLGDQAGAIAGPAITAIKQAITQETGNAATPTASAITAGNGQSQIDACEVLSTAVHFIPSSEPELMRDVLAICHGLRTAQQAQEPVAWVWNPAKESWEQVRAYGHWQQGAIYAFGPNPPAPKQAEPSWQPIESAPVNQEVIVAIEGGGVTIGSIMPTFGWTWYETDDEPDDSKVIGWQPLPTPPGAA